MIQNVTIERGTSSKIEQGGDREPSMQKDKAAITSVELAFDQHFGIRVEVLEGQWSKVSFREGGLWSQPFDTRAIVREHVKG